MERHRCKLCFRNFVNGRALGGHMKSHMMNLYASKNAEKIQENDYFEPGFCSDSSSPPYSSEEEEEGREESDPVLVPDRESETESSKETKRPVHRRSKRVRKSRIFYSRTRFSMEDFFVMKKKNEVLEAEPLSSVSDTTTEEDVAYCLMMMSRDKWEEKKEIKENGDMEKINKSSNKVRGKYRCETCNKLFRSYQALGGHRASHKRIKLNAVAPPGQNENSGGGSRAAEKIHECPFCHRVFASGQALGGHKRSHFVGASAISSNFCPPKQFSRTGESLDIDLNLPPQDDDDDDDDEISQIAISAVSDAENFLQT